MAMDPFSEGVGYAITIASMNYIYVGAGGLGGFAVIIFKELFA
jgi:hypothetical protein